MWSTALSALLVAYVPGAVIFRLPVAQRERRAGLRPEERLFWAMILSLALTSVVALGLAAAGWYRFERLLLVDAGVSAVLIVLTRARLRLPSGAAPLSWSAAVAVGLVVLSVSIIFSVPPAEYVMGGKDPGTYVNEGIQIAQRGTLTMTTHWLRRSPQSSVTCICPTGGLTRTTETALWGFISSTPTKDRSWVNFHICSRFGSPSAMGCRASLERVTSSVCCRILGMMAVYFCGSWLVGRPAAAAGAILLTVNVAAVWYSRYPNAEIMMQILVFAGILAFSRPAWREIGSLRLSQPCCSRCPFSPT